MKTAELKKYIRKSGNTQAELAKSMGIDPATFNLKLNATNNRVFTIDEALKLSELVEIPNCERSSIFFDNELTETQV